VRQTDMRRLPRMVQIIGGPSSASRIRVQNLSPRDPVERPRHIGLVELLFNAALKLRGWPVTTLAGRANIRAPLQAGARVAPGQTVGHPHDHGVRGRNSTDLGTGVPKRRSQLFRFPYGLEESTLSTEFAVA
jgi:hypothetical protein